MLNRLRAAMDAVEPLLRLREGWDSYGGLPISDQAARHAVSVIEALHAMPMPAVVPMANGCISLEWHRGPGVEFSVEVGPDGPGSVYLHRDGHEWPDWESTYGDASILVAGEQAIATHDRTLLERLDGWVEGESAGPLIRWAAAHVRGCLARSES